jgi:DMSO/TMAO reductase YedYZ heme-binding membrane subunit
MMGSEVAGTVEYTHDGGNTERFRYTIEITPGLEVKRDDSSITNPLLGNGQIIGFLTLGILIVIIVNGFSKTSRKILAKPLKVKDPQNIHCYLSLVIILFGVFHGSLLIIGPYSWNSEPNLFGASALAIFGIMAVTSFSRNRIVDRFGDKNWKRLHLIFTILVASILIYHVVTFGGHFS